MARQKPLGEFEIIVIAATQHRGKEAYGAAIKRDIEERTSRKASIGAIYTTLSRLEAKGYATSSLGEPTAIRGGKPKRFFEITPLGEEVFSQSLTMIGNMVEGLHQWPNPTR